MSTSLPSSELFDAIQTLNFEQLDQLSIEDLRFILPCLIRICDLSNIDKSKKWFDNRKKLKKIISTIPESNKLLKISKINYPQLEIEVKKDLQLRLKSSSLMITNQPFESPLLSSIIPSTSAANNISLIKLYEHSEDPLFCFKLILHELISLFIHCKNQSYQSQSSMIGPIATELFDTEIYLDEYVDYIFFAITEMPNTFQLFEIVEAFLYIKNGLSLIVRLVANFPESFNEICTSLINNSDSNVIDEQSFHSINRVQVLRKLCQMNKSESLSIRNEAIESCRMPNLIIMLTLDHLKCHDNDDEDKDDDEKQSNSDVLSFLSAILLSNDDKTRSWFTQYIKRKNSDNSIQTNCFLEFREQLLKRFRSITESMMEISRNGSNEKIQESIITEACLMLRLYCALRGVSMMKLNDEETQAISKLIVCRPPHIDIGVRFVSVGLCMILAFPQMIISQETEIIEWIKWLVKEENYFGQKANTRASFGEMLLLIAIFFHSNQLTQIGELVSSTIGIKHSSRTNDLTLIKHIFIQDIFTEQTVTAHAIKVPVTKNLNNSITGTLPIHCIYQLLKSRAFTKNKVPIKNWIFQQLCNCLPPIHHILPSLIEAYVNSILLPTSQSAHMTNEPISEDDLCKVFQRTAYSFEPNQLQKMNDNHKHSDDSNDEDSNDTDDDDSDMNDSDDKMDVDDDETEDENDDQTKNNSTNQKDDSLNSVSCLLTSQILFLYYVLLYEDVRLSNIRNVDRTSLTYSSEFMSRLPIFYLIQRTQTSTNEYGLLRPQLLRLISFHYPHLCLVRDWLPRPNFSVTNHRSLFSLQDRHRIKQIISQRKRLKILFCKVLHAMKEKCYNSNREPFYYLEQLIKLPDELLWPFANDFIQLLPFIMDFHTPKKISLSIKQIWFRLNHIFPTKLWVMTINILRNNCVKNGNKNGPSFSNNIWHGELTWDDLVTKPNFIFHCDERVFRTPELMEILLHILNGFLSASKIKCIHHNIESNGRYTSEDDKKEKEEFSKIYNLVSDSTASQLLLDCCSKQVDQNIQENYHDVPSINVNNNCLLSNFREIQGLICTHLHQCFIADWNLAKIVSSQGYNPEYLPMTVSGIPSLHICLDFIPEILQYEDLTRQLFAIELTSYLCVQYPITRSYSIARLCFEFVDTLLTQFSDEIFCQFFLSILPALERMTKTFPPLIEGFLKLLIKLGQHNISSSSLKPGLKIFCKKNRMNSISSFKENIKHRKLINITWSEFYQEIIKSKLTPEESLSLAIHKAFAMVCQLNSINRIYNDQTLKNF